MLVTFGPTFTSLLFLLLRSPFASFHIITCALIVSCTLVFFCISRISPILTISSRQQSKDRQNLSCASKRQKNLSNYHFYKLAISVCIYTLRKATQRQFDRCCRSSSAYITCISQEDICPSDITFHIFFVVSQIFEALWLRIPISFYRKNVVKFLSKCIVDRKC